MRSSPNRLVVALLLAMPLIVDAQEPTAQEIRAAFEKVARQYTVTKDGSETPLPLHPAPILKWANPERSEQQGLAFVWHDDGLPLAVGSFFTFQLNGLRAKHEFHSLANGPLLTKFRGKTAWTPSEPGVKWTALPGSGPPSKSKGLRSTQMKRIASSFELWLYNPNGERRKLRLLTTPLHRFSSPTHEIDDGMIFSYTVATDPEALLLVVAKGGQWRYAFARFHYWQLEAKRMGSRVWFVELDMAMERNRLGDEAQMNRVYNSFYPEPDYLFRP